MTAGELIAAVDALRPNQYDTEQKLLWLRELDWKLWLEGQITWKQTEGQSAWEQLTAPYTEDTVLLAPFPYDWGLYTNWLFCQIDLNNAEILKYNQSMTLFSAAWRQLADHWNRTRELGMFERWKL